MATLLEVLQGDPAPAEPAVDTVDDADGPESSRNEELLLISGNLMTLLEKENEALKSHDRETVAGLLEQKNKLSRAFERQIKVLQENPDELKGSDEETRERLRISGQKLDGLIAENARLLTVAVQSGKRLMNTIAEAVKSSNTQTQAYSTRGTYGPSGKRSGSGNLSISLDQSL